MNEQLNPAKTFFGACPHDCPDTCAMIYEVEDGKLVNVKGNKEHPITRGASNFDIDEKELEALAQ